VSRQYEEEYYRYYGWPGYWAGGELWGAIGFPVLQPLYPFPEEPAIPAHHSRNGNDPHLRSMRALDGYHIQTSEGAIGHLTDFIMDDQRWAIRHLVVETGHWYSGKEIVLSPKHIDRISYQDSTVFVNVTKEVILHAPEYHMPRLGGNCQPTRNLG